MLVIALVIIGPQRFPEVARQVARWIQTARSFTDAVMTDVRAAVDELEQDVTASNGGVNPIRELETLQQELRGAARDATATVSDVTATVSDASTLPALPERTDAAPAPETAAGTGTPSNGATGETPGPSSAAPDAPEPAQERTASS